MKRAKMKRGKKMFLGIVAILAIVILFTLFYYNKAFPEALEITNTMEKVGNDYYFYGDTKVGFIIFSGAKADERAYAYTAKLLHEAGHTAVIAKPIIHMTATKSRGLAIMESNPEIEKWFLIGHSLGGMPTTNIAVQQPTKLKGVVYLASYILADISELDIPVIRITASNDLTMNKKMMDDSIKHLPENSLDIEIEGANHQGFSAYKAVGRDGMATISWKEQQEQTVKLILDFFDAQIHNDSLGGQEK